MYRKSVSARIFVFLFLSALILFSSSCSNEPKTLIIYSGKGLKIAVAEIVSNFKQHEGVDISVIYAGSKTLLDTIKKTRRGDVFIPGSQSYVEQAGNLITHHEFVAVHVPTFVVSRSRSKDLKNYHDLLMPDVRLAVGNKNMAAIGRITEAILQDAPDKDNFRDRIIVTASTVTELLQLVANEEVDAALVWKDMLQWENAAGLNEVKIPESLNRTKEIRVGTLSTSTEQELARRFADYASSDAAKAIFVKHGFSK